MFRCIFKYISLLFISGLILPFYFNLQFKALCVSLLPQFAQTTYNIVHPIKQLQDNFGLVKAIAGDLFPVLNNLE